MAPTVGAERSGRTAVSHRQEMLVDLYLARLLRIFLRRKQAGQQSFPVLLPQPLYVSDTEIKLLDINASGGVQRISKSIRSKVLECLESDHPQQHHLYVVEFKSSTVAMCSPPS